MDLNDGPNPTTHNCGCETSAQANINRKVPSESLTTPHDRIAYSSRKVVLTTAVMVFSREVVSLTPRPEVSFECSAVI